MDATGVSGIAGWIDDRARRHLFSGVALVWRDGSPLFMHAAGLANRGLGVPVQPDSRFLVASVTKLVTGVTALRLVDRGLLDFHGSAAAVLPPAQRPASLAPEVTLHHLLSHTSGVANYHVDEDETWASFTSCWDRIPTYHLRGPGAMLPLFADRPARFAPGERFSYADANFLLVGLMIEAVTGERFPEVVRAEVFEVAGMPDSGFPCLDEDPPRLATGYLVTDDPPHAWRSNVYSVPAGGMPDGGLVTTATDLARLLDALQSGALLPPDLHAAMTSPQNPLGTTTERYGYGCELEVVDGVVTVLGHGGLDPGVSARVHHHVSSRTTIVVLCNQDRGSWPVTEHLVEYGAYGLERSRP